MRKGQRGKKIGPSSSRAALSPKDRLRQQAYALRSQRDFVSAKPLLEELYKLEPDNIPLALDLGEAYMETEDFAAAVSLYAKMIERDPKYLTAVTNLGGALIRQGKLADAKAILQYALELDPQSIHARINLGGVLQASGDRKANLDNALEAVQIDPSSSLAFNNLGSAFSDMAMFKEAKHAYETAVMLDAHQVDALINLGAVEARLGDPKASCEMYEKVLTQLPAAAKQRADAVKFYAAFEYLKQGVLDKGWDYYEGGFSPLVPATGARTPRRNFNVPRWDGEPIAGKTLLVWREQGLGDELLFATCLHELETLGASIIVECDRRLVPVFERSFPNYKIRQETYLPNHGMVSPYSDFNLHVPLGSLMKYFRRDIKDFERSGAYIKTDPAKVAKFAERLAPYKDDYRLVGICWRSGKLDPVRNLSYTSLKDWYPVLNKRRYKFVNLQYGECEREIREAEESCGIEILRWPDLDLRNDLDEIFCLMECLDEIYTVQTAVLVMAGCIGTPTLGVKAGGGWTALGQSGSNPWFPFCVTSSRFDPEQIARGAIALMVLEPKFSNLYKEVCFKLIKKSSPSTTDLPPTEVTNSFKLKNIKNEHLFDVLCENDSLDNDEIDLLAETLLNKPLGTKNSYSETWKHNLRAYTQRLARQGRWVDFDRQYQVLSVNSKEDPLTQEVIVSAAHNAMCVGNFDLALRWLNDPNLNIKLECLPSKILLKLLRTLSECGEIEKAVEYASLLTAVGAYVPNMYSEIAESFITNEEWSLALDLLNLDRAHNLYQREASFHIHVMSNLHGSRDTEVQIPTFYEEYRHYKDGYSVIALNECAEGRFSEAERLIQKEWANGRVGYITVLATGILGIFLNTSQKYTVLSNKMMEVDISRLATLNGVFAISKLRLGEIENAKVYINTLDNLGESGVFAALPDLFHHGISQARDRVLTAYRTGSYGHFYSGLTLLDICQSLLGLTQNQPSGIDDKKIRRYRRSWLDQLDVT